MPRYSHYCGQLNVHDIAFTPDGGIIGINTLLSCLFRLDRQHSFVPMWKPPFISTLATEDSCHLDGMAMVEDKPKYVTALGNTDEASGWRAGKLNGGVLLDVDSNETL